MDSKIKLYLEICGGRRVRQPILGADFLSDYKLIVDCHNTCVFDEQQVTIIQGEEVTALNNEIHNLQIDSDHNTYKSLIENCNRYSRENESGTSVEHVIKLTGLPAAQRARS